MIYVHQYKDDGPLVQGIILDSKKDASWDILVVTNNAILTEEDMLQTIGNVAKRFNPRLEQFWSQENDNVRLLNKKESSIIPPPPPPPPVRVVKEGQGLVEYK